MILFILGLAIFLQQEPVAKSDKPQQTVFSGPQAGEKIAALSIRRVGEKEAIDVAKQFGDGPLVVIFVHKVTRPGFQLARQVVRVGEYSGKADKLKNVVVFLTDDPPSIEKQVTSISRFIEKTAIAGVSTDGAEGPGAYGLNRNVLMTILVTNQRKVVANFALTQPSLQVDGPKIASAIAKLVGAKKVPDITRLGNPRRQRVDPVIHAYLRSLTGARDDDAVNRVSASIEKWANNPDKKRQLAKASQDMLNQKGTARVKAGAARSKMEAWVKYNAPQDPNLRPLLQPFIQKTNTDEQTLAAAKKIEDYVSKNPSARGQVGDICRRIINADKLKNYGTSKCQEIMKRWAKEFRQPKNQPDTGQNPSKQMKPDSESGGKLQA